MNFFLLLQQNFEIFGSKIQLIELIIAIIVIVIGILWFGMFIYWLIKKKRKIGNS